MLHPSVHEQCAALKGVLRCNEEDDVNEEEGDVCGRDTAHPPQSKTSGAEEKVRRLLLCHRDSTSHLAMTHTVRK